MQCSLPLRDHETSFRKIETLSGKKIGIKPWKIREEKDVLFAIENQTDDDVIRDEIIKMISRCVDDQSVFKSLSNVSYVHLLMELRKISKGNKIEYSYRCTNEKCKFELSDDVDLSNDCVIKPYTGGTVVLNEIKSVVLKEVSFSEYDELRKKFDRDSEYSYNYILKSIESVIDEGELYSNFTQKDLDSYIGELTFDELKTLRKHIDESVATIELKKKLTCGRCKTVHDVDFGDLYNFLFF